jgi:hypothetical protein
MEHKFTFLLTLPEAQQVVFALKKKPMEEVEALVHNLDTQFNTEMKKIKDAEQAANSNSEQNKEPTHTSENN